MLQHENQENRTEQHQQYWAVEGSQRMLPRQIAIYRRLSQTVRRQRQRTNGHGAEWQRTRLALAASHG